MSRLLPLAERGGAVTAALVYAIVAFLFFLRPVLGDPADVCVCQGPFNPDAYLYMWNFEWWPHALTNLDDPVTTKAIFWPEGANLARVTSVPGPALAAAPFTALGGPILGYNVVAASAPALSAFTAFLLCRRLTGSFYPALFGGYMFGFSSYVLAQLTGHLNLFLVFLLPVLVHLTLRYVDGELSTTRYALFAGLALFGQLLISTEILFTTTLFAVVSLALAYALMPAGRPRLRASFPGMATAYAVAGLLGSVFIYNALRGGGPDPPGVQYGIDPMNLLLPTTLVELGGDRSHNNIQFSGGFAEAGAYLGLPLLAMVAHWLVSNRRRASARLLAGVALVAIVLGLGHHVTVNRFERAWAPWDLLDGLPLFEAVQPVRFSLFLALVASLIGALWVARANLPRGIRWAVAAAAALALFPSLGDRYWYNRPEAPPFFVDDGFKRYLDEDDVALLLPHKFSGRAMLWHARAGLEFRMAGGYLGETGYDPQEDEPLYPMFRDARVPAIPNADRELASYIDRHDVDLVVIDPAQTAYWPYLLGRAGFRGHQEGGVVVFPTKVPGS